MSRNYQEQLKDPRWLRRRWEILERDKCTCQKCGWRGPELIDGRRIRPSKARMIRVGEPKRLEVHHLYYRDGLLAWEYCGSALITLCNQCHEKEGRKPTIKSHTEWHDATDELRARLLEVFSQK